MGAGAGTSRPNYWSPPLTCFVWEYVQSLRSPLLHVQLLVTSTGVFCLGKRPTLWSPVLDVYWEKGRRRPHAAAAPLAHMTPCKGNLLDVYWERGTWCPTAPIMAQCKGPQHVKPCGAGTSRPNYWSPPLTCFVWEYVQSCGAQYFTSNYSSPALACFVWENVQRCGAQYLTFTGRGRRRPHAAAAPSLT
ncbi:hypothetical protein NL676_014554 [Syzygium grande]|nr:hypothetical protein NL676_014554 [Syzygium grande]